MLISIIIIYFITPIIVYDIIKYHYYNKKLLSKWKQILVINRYILLILLITHILIEQVNNTFDKFNIYALLYLIWSWDVQDSN